MAAMAAAVLLAVLVVDVSGVVDDDGMADDADLWCGKDAVPGWGW